MKESDFQTAFRDKNTIHGVFELKFCKGKSLPFSALVKHQEEALLEASSSEGVFHKITDQPIFKNEDIKTKTRFTKKKPFDCFLLKNTNAYVVVMWWVPRKKKKAYYIRIQDWILARGKAGRKSITEDIARIYAVKIEDYFKGKNKA